MSESKAMKKRLSETLAVAGLVVSMTILLSAQTSNQDRLLIIQLKNGKTVTYTLEEIESIRFSDTAKTAAAKGIVISEREMSQGSSATASISSAPIGPIRLLAGSQSNSGATGPASLFDGRSSTGWSSRPDARFPHEFVIELPQPVMIGTLEFDNGTQEGVYPGASARDVTVLASNGSQNGPWINVATVTLARGINQQRFSIAPVTARWIRLAVRSNYGHPNYTQLMEVRFYQAGDVRPAP
jgi:hypothetical protein